VLSTFFLYPSCFSEEEAETRVDQSFPEVTQRAEVEWKPSPRLP
jgi:hypothetical protein